MNSDDCVVITVSPGKVENEFCECPMCGGDIYHKNMASTCKKKIEGHNVCNACHGELTQKYYKDGIGCVYCGDPKTKQEETRENVIHVPERSMSRVSTEREVVVIQRNDRELLWRFVSCDISGFCLIFWITFCIIACIATVFVMCNIFYFIGSGILHWLYGEDHISHGTDMTLKRAVYGFSGFMVLSYIGFQIYMIIDICAINFCGNCYNNFINKIYSSHLCNLIKVCLTCEPLPLPDDSRRRSRRSVSPTDSDSE